MEQGDTLSDSGGVIDGRGDVEDPRTEMYARGRRREITEEHLVGGEVRVLGEEMMLGRPGVLEADALRGLHDRDLVHDPSMLVAPKLRKHTRAVEQSEFHDYSPLVRAC